MACKGAGERGGGVRDRINITGEISTRSERCGFPNGGAPESTRKCREERLIIIKHARGV